MSSAPLTPVCAEKDRFRWWLVWTLFFSTAVNYIHRQTLSVLAPAITAEFHLSHAGYAS